ncbi:type I-E CRISPR-associated protein Cas6/Cse3/CasE [Streptomyces sp. NPDC026673]|uniref:type I-E CRISPR-associated protein Cas6/Cse3/CasE n=1 Tax=Streptomyces sp. NPDC026673 TaxID=3155724 RepID=UPI0033D02CEE
MPYLSKIPLNPRRRGATALLGNPYRLHTAVLAGLALQPVSERVLWRLESHTAHRAELLVLTESRPAWQHLIEEAGWPDADGGQAFTADYAPVLERLVVGREFAFKLTANPVHSVRRPSQPKAAQASRLEGQDSIPGTSTERSARGVRVPQRTAAQQLNWLLNKADRHGFTIPAMDPATGAPAPSHESPQSQAPTPAVSLFARNILYFRKHSQGRQITLATATFQGKLRVTDPTALRAALLCGIGPGRGYGQGLLTLAPPRDHPCLTSEQ